MDQGPFRDSREILLQRTSVAQNYRGGPFRRLPFRRDFLKVIAGTAFSFGAGLPIAA
jgi:hypothetical protein